MPPGRETRLVAWQTEPLVPKRCRDCIPYSEARDLGSRLVQSARDWAASSFPPWKCLTNEVDRRRADGPQAPEEPALSARSGVTDHCREGFDDFIYPGSNFAIASAF